MRPAVLSSFLVVLVEAQWGQMFGWQQQPPRPQQPLQQWRQPQQQAWQQPQQQPQQQTWQQPQPQWQQPWQQQRPIQPQVQPQPQQTNQLFPNLLQQIQNAFTLPTPPPTTAPTTTAAPTTTSTQEPIVNTDLDAGPWKTPDPASWPEGPDWNDIRNGWNGEFGWGGRNGHKPQPSAIIRVRDTIH